jgi:hypothetical protein
MRRWCLAIGFVFACAVASLLHAQQPVIVTGSDPSGPTVTTVGNAKDNSLRTHQVGVDPLLRPTFTLARLVNAFGLPYSDAAPLPVVIRAGDPCAGPNKFNIPISQAANTKLLSGPGRKLYLCSMLIVAADAENVSLVEGTGSTCGTGTLAIVGGTTAATGPNLPAGGGWQGGGGAGTIAVTGGVDLCLFQSGSGRVAGNLTYAIQ